MAFTPQQEQAVTGFIDTFDGYTLDDLARAGLTCTGADAWVAMLNAFNETFKAKMLAKSHADTDDEGDVHYVSYEDTICTDCGENAYYSKPCKGQES